VSANAFLADDLNSFYAWFAASNNTVSGTVAEVRDKHTFPVTEHDVRRALMRVNNRKVPGPHSISGRVLKTCANQLAPVFTTIFNLSLDESVFPVSFKWSTIVPVPKTASPARLNNYRLVALTSVVMKLFERLIKDYICAFLPPSMVLLQFAYRPDRPQVIRVGRHTSRPLTLNTGSPRVASSVPYCTPCTHMTV